MCTKGPQYVHFAVPGSIPKQLVKRKNFFISKLTIKIWVNSELSVSATRGSIEI